MSVVVLIILRRMPAHHQQHISFEPPNGSSFASFASVMQQPIKLRWTFLSLSLPKASPHAHTQKNCRTYRNQTKIPVLPSASHRISFYLFYCGILSLIIHLPLDGDEPSEKKTAREIYIFVGGEAIVKRVKCLQTATCSLLRGH